MGGGAPVDDKRKEPRLRLALPVRIVAFDPDGSTWHEMSTTHEVSSGGASFDLRHPHSVGQVLLLYVPLPRSLRRYGLVDASYRTYALVRSSRQAADAREVGVTFLGQYPPRDFFENPGGRYAMEGDTIVPGKGERRRHERLQLFVNLKLRRAGDRGQEQTVTENVSLGGMRVLTTLAVQAGDLLVVSDLEGTASASAVVRNTYRGPDGITRLNLQFPDPSSLRQLLLAAGAPPLPEESAHGADPPGGPEPQPRRPGPS